jgi:hypothetical protein
MCTSATYFNVIINCLWNTCNNHFQTPSLTLLQFENAPNIPPMFCDEFLSFSIQMLDMEEFLSEETATGQLHEISIWLLMAS